MSQREIAQAAGRLAAANRYKKSSEERARAHADLATARIADYVEKALAQAPPLTSSQRQRIASLLTPTCGASS